MKKFGIRILQALCPFICLSGLAQVISSGPIVKPLVYTSSPQASSLGSYGNETVNMFTGRPNINIDLYTISVNDYKLPITLNYNLSSVMPEEHPGILGLGWNLVSGGVVTRTVKGGVDEYFTSQASPNNKYSYYDNYATLDRSDWISQTVLTDLTNKMKTIGPSGTVAYPAPDEFHFNVNGLSGTFYKNHKGQWVISSGDNMNLKISDELKQDYEIKTDAYYTPEGEPGPAKTFLIKRIIYGFTITDEKGIKYVFGKVANSIDFSADASTVSDTYRPNFVAKAWYLTKIILPNNKAIEFTYSFDRKATFKMYKNFDMLAHSVNAGSVGNSTATPAHTISLIRNFFVYPETIKTDELLLTFNKSIANDLDNDYTLAPWELYESDQGEYYRSYYMGNKHYYKLDGFSVKSIPDNKIIYQFGASFNEMPTKRLSLESITETGEAGESRSHFFEYNPNSLPPYGSEKLDHWGYFNNMNYFQSVSNPYNYNNLKTLFQQYKAPSGDSALVQAEILTKITYPTKGYTRIFYESNNYSKYVKGDLSGGTIGFSVVSTTNSLAGGIRVKKIVSDPLNNGAPITKEYFYVQDYLGNNMNSSGVLGGRPTYFEEGTDGGGLKFYRLKSLPVLAPNYTGGSHITYTKVFQKDADDAITEFTFSNQDNGSPDRSANSYLYNFVTTDELSGTLLNKLSYNSMDHERGKLISVKNYNSNHELLLKTEYLYNNAADRFDDKIRSIDFNSAVYGQIQQTASGPTIAGVTEVTKMSAYNVYSYYPYLSRKITTTYNKNDSVKITSDYAYTTAPYYMLRWESTYNSKNKKRSSAYQYPFDFNEQIYNNMTSANIISPLIEQRDTSGTKEIKITGTSYSKYDYTDGLNSYSLYKPSSAHELYPNTEVDTTLKVFSYDQYGNPLDVEQSNGIAESYQWDQTGLYPVAKVTNAKNLRTGVAIVNRNGSFYLPGSNLSTQTFTLSDKADGNININMTWNSYPGSYAEARINYKLTGSNITPRQGSACIRTPGSTECPNLNTSVSISNVPPGNYTLEITPVTNIISVATTSLYVSYSYPKQETYTISEKEFFYEDFEVNGNATATPFTGKKYYSGTYTVPFYPGSPQNYIIDYRYFEGGIWKLKTLPFGYNFTLPETTVDEVRVYHKDAQMTTYTYRPLVGMASQTDPSGITTFYQYDGFGRLNTIKDEKGNIVRKICYNNAGQTINCNQ